MTPEMIYRMAEASECGTLAEMINLASGGAVDFLFHDLVPEMTPVRIIAGSLARGGAAHSYENAHVAPPDRTAVPGAPSDRAGSKIMDAMRPALSTITSGFPGA
jgi:hypothetical protein